MNGFVVALLIALCGGLAVSFQGVLNSLAGRALGAPLTGLLVNIAGGTLSLLLLALFSRSLPLGAVDVKAASTAVLAGGIGVFVVFSIAFALPRVGVAAGIAAVILGQLALSVLADALGWSGTVIPVDLRRVLGLALLAGGVVFLLPPQS